MSEFTMGSLFSGIGGLDEGVRAALGGGDLRFVADVEKGPSQVLAARYPRIPNLGDITKVDWHEIEPVDVLCGGSPCFTAGTLVETEEGARPIEEVRVGDMVRTHLGRYRRVTAIGGYYADDVLELRIMGAPRFQVTPNHPFYVREEKKRRNPFTSKRWKSQFSDPKWVKAGDLCTTEVFLTTHYVGVKLDDPDDTPVLGTALARLIGLWLSTPMRRVGKRSSVLVRVPSRDVEWLIGELGTDAGTRVSVVNQKRGGSHATIRVDSKRIAGMLREFQGETPFSDRVPAWVHRLPLAEQEQIWLGWCCWKSEGDSTPACADQSSSVVFSMARIARSVFRRAAEVVAVRDEDGSTAFHRVRLPLPEEDSESFVEDGWMWLPVLANLAYLFGRSAFVYNISVDEDESYTAWGYTVHNCQDLSVAGARSGMGSGTRSGLWSSMRDAISIMRPGLVVWENVRGALSARAESAADGASALGRGIGRVGGGGGEPRLRALGRVVGDLASIGYDSQWAVVRASDAGAPHQRARVFLVAHPHGQPWDQRGITGSGQEEERWAWAHPRGRGGEPGGLNLPTPTASDRKECYHPEGKGLSLTQAIWTLPTPQATFAAYSSDGYGPNLNEAVTSISGGEEKRSRFGKYEQAVRRWELLTRPAPEPTEPPIREGGKRRLSPEFASWMMGFPEGWVTGGDVGLSRAHQLKAIGNAVVPQQAALAVSLLLERHRALFPEEYEQTGQ